MVGDGVGGDEYWVPECVRSYLRTAGYSTRALEDMEPHVREWDRWMRAVGEFYDYRDTDGFGRAYQVHRRTIMPAMRVCREWGSLLLDEKTVVACKSRECADWPASFFSSTDFWGRAQETVVRAFGLGTGAFAVWLDSRCSRTPRTLCGRSTSHTTRSSTRWTRARCGCSSPISCSTRRRHRTARGCPSPSGKVIARCSARS